MSYKNLIAYQKAFAVAMEIFRLSKLFPKEELFALTSQIQRSSRAVCSNLAEGYRKRMYKAHFISKVSDADMENSETQVWLEFATACGYISPKLSVELYNETSEIGKLLNYMINNPEKFC